MRDVSRIFCLLVVFMTPIFAQTRIDAINTNFRWLGPDEGIQDHASKRKMLGIAMAYETLARRAELLAARERPAETNEKPDCVRYDDPPGGDNVG